MLNKATVTGLLALNAQVPEALYKTLFIPRAILRLEAWIYVLSPASETVNKDLLASYIIGPLTILPFLGVVNMIFLQEVDICTWISLFA